MIFGCKHVLFCTPGPEQDGESSQVNCIYMHGPSLSQRALQSVQHTTPSILRSLIHFFWKRGRREGESSEKKMSLAGLEPGMLQFMVSALSIAQQRPSEPYYSYNVLYVFYFNNKRNNLRIYSE